MPEKRFIVGEKVRVPDKSPTKYKWQGEDGAWQRRNETAVIKEYNVGLPYIVDVTFDNDGHTQAWFEVDLDPDLSQEDVDAAIASVMRRET